MISNLVIVVITLFVAYFFLSKIFHWIVLGAFILFAYMFFSGQFRSMDSGSQTKSIVSIIEASLLGTSKNTEANNAMKAINDQINEKDKVSPIEEGSVANESSGIKLPSLFDSLFDFGNFRSSIGSIIGQFRYMTDSLLRGIK